MPVLLSSRERRWGHRRLRYGCLTSAPAHLSRRGPAGHLLLPWSVWVRVIRIQGLRLAELVAAFSLATDLGMGQPMEHVLRSQLSGRRPRGR